ncbi:MAG: hypothetical protein ACYCZN_01440 [Candidatus Dormibacteria bacterium]
MNMFQDPEFLALDPKVQARLRSVLEAGRVGRSNAEMDAELAAIQAENSRLLAEQGRTVEDVLAGVSQVLHPGREASGA